MIVAAPVAFLEGRLVLRWAAVDGAPAAAPTDLWLGELLVGAGWPLRAGPAVVAPGLALGIGLDGSERAACGAACTRLVRDGAWEVQAAPRVEAGVSVCWELAAALAVEAAVSGSLTPFGATPASPAWAEGTGDAFALAAVPGARIRAGLGLAWRPR